MRRVIRVLVLGLIVLLAGSLLLSAVRRARKAATVSRCWNNLRQLGFALSAYHEVNSCFPEGTYHNPTLPPERRLSWLFTIDPYVHARMDEEWTRYRKQPWDSEDNLRLARQRMPIYTCPGAPTGVGPDGLVLTSYVGAAGLGSDAATLPRDHPRAGLFGYDQSTTLKEITDGPGGTIAVIETAADNGPWMAGGRATLRGLDLTELPVAGRGRPFGGLHRNGTNVLLVDGSVRFLADTVQPQTWGALFTIAGGDEPGPLPDE